MNDVKDGDYLFTVRKNGQTGEEIGVKVTKADVIKGETFRCYIRNIY